MIDVSVLRFAVAARTKTFVERELARVTSQLTGAELLREAGLVLRRVRDEWLYGGAINEPLRSDAEATLVAAQHATAARAPGSGDLLVVSIIVCAQGELVTVTPDNVVEELRRALEAGAYRSDLVSVDVAWTTANSDELAERFPELLPFGGSLVGKTICAHCGGPFPAELVSCPHCGAPARAA